MKEDLELIKAFENQDLEAMELAIQKGADVNCFHPDGASILAIAVDSAIDSCIQFGDKPGEEELEFVDLLVRNGADIDLKLNGSHSAVESARVYKAEHVVTHLKGINS